jgi:hypothetical protein
MQLSGAIALALAASVSPGGAEEPIVPVQVEISGVVKFSAEELVRALRPRLPPDAPAGTLSVTARPDGMIELSWQSRKRVVDLSEDSGPAAARVAALLAADLLPLGPPAPPAVERVASPTIAPDLPGFVSLAAGYGLWSGDGHGPLLHGPTVALGLDRKRLRLRVEGGRLTGQPQPSLAMTAWPLRFSAGLGTASLALLGALVMVPYELEGAWNLTRTLTGAGVGLESRFPIASGVVVCGNAGFDVFVGKRLQVVAGGRSLFDSPWWALRFGVAVAWGHAR